MNAAKRSPRANSNTPTSGVYTRGGFETPANLAEDTSLESLVRLASTRPEATEASEERFSVPPLLAFGAKPIVSLLPPSAAGELSPRAKVLIAVPWTLLGITLVSLATVWPRGKTESVAPRDVVQLVSTARAATVTTVSGATGATEPTLEGAPVPSEATAPEPTLTGADTNAETQIVPDPTTAPAEVLSADDLATAALLAAGPGGAIESPLVEPPAVDSAAVEAAGAAPSVDAPAAAAPAANVVHTFDQIQARIQAGPTAVTSGAVTSTPDRPSRADVASALRRVQSGVDACTANVGRATIRLTVANDGSVSAASATGEYAGTSEGACMAEAVRGARFPAFTASPITLSYPFTLH